MTPSMRPPAGGRTNITTPSDREIRIERTFHASRERVWKALTEPALLAQWWGPATSRVEIERLELRRGGHWRFVEHGAKAPTASRAAIARSLPPSGSSTRSSGTACPVTWSSRR